jgi:NADH pyrophosphatase NudC (nudix superfamily)
MVWIINEQSNRVQEVALGSPQMLAARNVYRTKQEADEHHLATCAHPTLLGNRSTGHIFCSDCGKPHN